VAPVIRRLEGRVVVVTGAATGIGRACAFAYAAEGAAVVVGDIDTVEAERTVALLGEAGGTAAFVRTDVASSTDCEALVASTFERFGRLDVVHANAGIELPKNVWDTTDEDWNRVLGVNLSGVFYVCRAAMTRWRDLGRGGVLTITASPHAFMTGKDIAAYAASKGGAVALMRALALEGAAHGIRANALLPGAIDTPMLHREISLASDPEATYRQFAQSMPLGRMGRPEDVAPVAVFLASADAAFVTGACYAADGGIMAALNAGPILAYTE
jgi:NAD(P)-dependent dehydrogenase (short-subunit alcohol dehydrogenase family)